MNIPDLQSIFEYLKKDTEPNKEKYLKLFEKACMEENLDQAQSIYNNIKNNGLINMRELELAFRNCCKSGKLNAAKWLLSSIPEIKDIYIKTHSHFDYQMADYYEHINVLEWIFEIANENKILITNYYIERIFDAACKNNCLETAIYIFNNKIKNINNINNKKVLLNEAFKSSCANGNLDLVKWLWKAAEENEIEIDINANREYAFIQSCANNHLEVTKWLWNKSIEIKSPIRIGDYYDIHFMENVKKAFANTMRKLIEIKKTNL